jgi:hypothetical protein
MQSQGDYQEGGGLGDSRQDIRSDSTDFEEIGVGKNGREKVARIDHHPVLLLEVGQEWVT